MSMACCPALPTDHSCLIRNTENHIHNTACWRGYIGTWEIRQDAFYLVAVEGLYTLQGEPILADWVSETLRIPCGNVLFYQHMGFMTIYEEELFVSIEKGRVTERRRIDNRGKTPEDFLPRPPQA